MAEHIAFWSVGGIPSHPQAALQVPPKRAAVRPSRGCRWYTAEAASHVKPSTGQRHGKHMAAIIARQREQEEREFDPQNENSTLI